MNFSIQSKVDCVAWIINQTWLSLHSNCFAHILNQRISCFTWIRIFHHNVKVELKTIFRNFIIYIIAFISIALIVWESVDISKLTYKYALSILSSERLSLEKLVLFFVWFELRPIEFCFSVLELIHVVVVLLAISTWLILWTVEILLFVSLFLHSNTILLPLIPIISTRYATCFNWTILPCSWVKTHLPIVIFLRNNCIGLFNRAMFVSSTVNLNTFDRCHPT